MLDAVRAAFGDGGRAPGRYSASARRPHRRHRQEARRQAGEHRARLRLDADPAHAPRTSSRAKDKALVGTIPTYEECAGYAEMMGHPVRAVSLDGDFKMDLGKIADAAEGRGAGVLLQPEQPDGDLRRRAGDARLPREGQPRVARHDDPRRRGVLRLRHRSRSRHAHPASPSTTRASSWRGRSRRPTAWPACAWATPSATPTRSRRCATGTAARARARSTCSALHAGIAAIEQDASFITAERARNTAARDFTMKWFADRGMKPTDSQANFMFVNIGRPAKEFREACRAKGVLVARDFPPFEKTHCRISFGTMDEMKKAVAVFGEVLAKKATAA